MNERKTVSRWLRAGVALWGIVVVCAEPCFAQCEAAELVASKKAGVDLFGGVVAMDGDVAAIAGVQNTFGNVRVFRRDGYEWIEEASLTAPEPQDFDGFGGGLDVTGD